MNVRKLPFIDIFILCTNFVNFLCNSVSHLEHKLSSNLWVAGWNLAVLIFTSVFGQIL